MVRYSGRVCVVCVCVCCVCVCVCVNTGGTKYLVEVVRRGPTAFCVTLNGSKAEVTTRKMADGGFLMQVCVCVCVNPSCHPLFVLHANHSHGTRMLALRFGRHKTGVCVCMYVCVYFTQVDGESHVVHVEEEAAGTRLAVGPATCLLAKEADPSRLVAGSPGEYSNIVWCARCTACCVQCLLCQGWWLDHRVSADTCITAGCVHAASWCIVSCACVCVCVCVYTHRQAHSLPSHSWLTCTGTPAIRRGTWLRVCAFVCVHAVRRVCCTCPCPLLFLELFASQQGT